jgi:xylulokinase
MDCFMGIDVGTSGVKILVSSCAGEVIAKAYIPYSTQFPFAGAVELDPDIVFASIENCFTACQQQCNMSRIDGISVSSQGEAIIPIDSAGHVLQNALCTFDMRNSEEFSWFCDHVDQSRIQYMTGMPLSPMFSATKLLWTRKKKPEVLNKAWKLVCFDGFVNYKLGAEPTIDYCLASRTMLFDLRKHEWIEDIVSMSGIAIKQLPKPVPAGSVIGILSPYYQRYGFSSSVKLIAGSHDQVCCCLGAGIAEPGIVMDSLGTTESMVCIGECPGNDYTEKHRLPVYDYPLTDQYAYMTFLPSCASSLNWLKKNILQDTGPDFYKKFDEYIMKSSGPSEILAAPYFCGTGTPMLDFSVPGFLFGLRLNTDVFQIYQGILEGINYEFTRNIHEMEKDGITIMEIRCIGGGANSDVWLQLKADILGKPVIAMCNNEAGCIGAIILAMNGCDRLHDLSDVKKLFIQKRKSFYPDEAKHRAYGIQFSKYLDLTSKILIR